MILLAHPNIEESKANAGMLKVNYGGMTYVTPFTLYGATMPDADKRIEDGGKQYCEFIANLQKEMVKQLSLFPEEDEEENEERLVTDKIDPQPLFDCLSK